MRHSVLSLVILFLLSALCCTLNKITSSTNYEDYPSYTGNDLGVTFSGDQTRFALWAPSADSAKLYIYPNADTAIPEQTYNMIKGKKDEPWRRAVNGLLYGKFYTFAIYHNGKWLKETPGIYAYAVGVNGDRGAIIDMATTNPEGWETDKQPVLNNSTDAVIYEMHHRDFSIDTTSGIDNKGKFLALTENGTLSPQGEKTGVDHLKELGVTHVHLLPSYDFGSIDERHLNENKYNWGYDPKNYNVPEGSYSTNPFNPATRVREMKEMIQALHRNGIGVIMDVVYNHTYVTDSSNFDLSVPGYFYRHNPDGSYSDASKCGNETASERTMMRQYIINSVLHWAREYHIDGFRFDLMGIHDIETMNILADSLKKINPSAIIYGEGWTAGPSPLPTEKQALKAHALQMPLIAVFNDDLRDGIKGSFSDGVSQGFVQGKPGLEESVKFGIVGATKHPQINYDLVNYSSKPYANSPAQSINYVSSHDDLCLTDKLIASNPKAEVEDLIRMDKLAQTIIFTSQGIPFIFNGEEIFRSKKGVHNSYQSPDSINAINWNNKTVYKDLFNYYKNLILLRKQHPAFRMTSAEQIEKHLLFIDTGIENVVNYMISNHANGDTWDRIWVAFNGNPTAKTLKVPGGKWKIICRDGEIDLAGKQWFYDKDIIINPSGAIILAQP